MLLRLVLLAFAGCLSGQQIITTFAGTEWVYPLGGGPALDAPLSSILSTAIDPQGRLVIADGSNNVVLRVDAGGAATVIAGNGLAGFSGDGGDALRASLRTPQAIVYDAGGNLYIADRGNRRLRRVTPAGVISTIAGTGNAGATGDGGPATAATLSPWRLAVGRGGEIYFSDIDNNRIRRIGTDGVITAVAGTGSDVFSGEGQPAVTTGLDPQGIAVDAAGRLLVADWLNHRVYRIGADGILRVIAGTGELGATGDGGPATAARMNAPTGVTTDAAGNILVCESNGRRVRKIDTAGVITTIAGGSTNSVTTTPQDALRTGLGFLHTLSIDQQGRVFIADRQNMRIFLLSADYRQISIIAGNGQYKDLGTGVPAALATITQPAGLAIAPDGSLYFSELSGHRIGRIARDGTATVVAGNGVASCCVDGGPAANGRVSSPNALAIAPDGSLIIVDGGSQKIRKIQNGTITSIGGITFEGGFSGDNGPATEARFRNPWGVAVDGGGNIYVADRQNHRVRRIDTRGVITTFAGNGQPGFSGDNGPATSASLNIPLALAFNAAGDLLIADFNNDRIRAVSPAGIIRTIGGNGTTLYTGDGGPATSAGIAGPRALAVDRSGNLFVGHDSGQIRRIDQNGVITTFAGQNLVGFAGDGGAPRSALFNGIWALAIDADGNLYVADANNNRIRVIRSLALTTTLTPSPVNISAVAGSASTIPARVSIASPINGLPFSTSVVYGQSPGNWLTLTASNTAAPATLTLSANATDLVPGRYTATITVTTTPPGPSNPVSVILTVTEVPARLKLSTESISFNRNEGSGADIAPLEVRNDGGGLLAYQITTTTANAAPWLKVSSATGALRAGQVGAVNVTADPAGLRAGTYLGSVNVIAGPARAVVPVTLTVRGVRRSILVSQSGLTFTAVAGGGSPTPQSIGILNVGSGVLSWRAAAKGRFVRLGATEGTVNQPWLEVSDLSIGVNPAGLAAGQYYEQVEISGDADNSPQLVTVLLNVLPEGANPGPEVTPSGMIFISKQGENPGSQSVRLNHLGRGAVTFDSSRLGSWYESAPGVGRAQANSPSNIVIAPSLAGLTPGVRRGVVTFQLQEDGSVRTVNLLSVVAPADAGDKSGRNASSCAAPSLRVESTALRDGFAVRVGEAVTVEVKAADECGNLLVPLAGGTGAQVIARPENGDPQVTLAHIGNGVWRGTWRPVRAVANTRLTVVAVYLGTSADVVAGRSQAGKVELSGAVLAQGATAAPLLTAGGVVHAASFETGVPIAPGSLITLYGSKLADKSGSAGTIPLPSSLNGTEVTLGDRPLPLLFTSDGQLNAQVPYDVPVDTQHQILVKRGEAIAVPETLSVAAAQPGIFTKSQNGSGQGAIVKQDGVTLAEPGTPAARGEVVIIYCSGLGPVSPPVVAGRPAPSSPLSGVINPVTVLIGGKEARVLFAGLAPGFSGLYQINAFVPADAATGNAVEVTVESAGQKSPPVTIAIR